MAVATLTHLSITDRASESNKCPLKVSLVGISQGKPTSIENTDNSIIEILITDHIESIIFVVSQMEIIDSKFYINAKDINCVNIKKKISETDHLQIQSASTNSTRSKLLHVHQNVTRNLKDTPVLQTPPMTTSSDIESEPLVKRKRSKEADQLIDMEFPDINNGYRSETNKTSYNVPDQEELEKPVKKKGKKGESKREGKAKARGKGKGGQEEKERE
ncbi:4375_t:CDS:2, partial [Cetraspora pellucida]